MKYIICATALGASILNGCTGVDGWEITQAIDVCAQHGGLAKITGIDNHNKAECVDGYRRYLERPKEN